MQARDRVSIDHAEPDESPSIKWPCHAQFVSGGSLRRRANWPGKGAISSAFKQMPGAPAGAWRGRGAGQSVQEPPTITAPATSPMTQTQGSTA